MAKLEESKIAELKAKYGEIHEFTVKDDNGKDLYAYFKKPDRYDVGVYLSHESVNRVKGYEAFAQNVIISDISDMVILENDKYFLSLCQHLDVLLLVKKSTFTSY